ncbi:hypothetical protein RCL1_009100 [Eukaryota sp. TZLM3-RCL]
MERQRSSRFSNSLIHLYSNFFNDLKSETGGNTARKSIESTMLDIRKTIAANTNNNNISSQNRGSGRGRTDRSQVHPDDSTTSTKLINTENSLSDAISESKSCLDTLCVVNCEEVQLQLALMYNRSHFLTKLLSVEDFDTFGAILMDYLFENAVKNVVSMPLYTSILKTLLNLSSEVDSNAPNLRSNDSTFSTHCIKAIQKRIFRLYVDDNGWDIEGELQKIKVSRENSGEIVSEKTMEIERFYKLRQLRDQVFHLVRFVGVLVLNGTLPFQLLLLISKTLLDNPYKPYSIEVVTDMWKNIFSKSKPLLLDGTFQTAFRPVLNRFEVLRYDENLMFESRSLCVDFLAYFAEQCQCNDLNLQSKKRHQKTEN